MFIDRNQMTEEEFSDLTNSFLPQSKSNIVTSESGLPITTEGGSAVTFGEPTITTNPLDTIKKVNESIAQKNLVQPQAVVPTEPVNVVDKMQTKQSEADRLRQILDDARKREALQSGAANFMSGIEKISAARAGAGLTQIKPDTKAYDKMAQDASETAKQNIQEEMAVMAKEKEEIANKRDSQVAETYRNLLQKATKGKLGNLGLSPESSKEDVMGAAQMLKITDALDSGAAGLSEADRLRIDIEKQKMLSDVAYKKDLLELNKEKLEMMKGRGGLTAAEEQRLRLAEQKMLNDAEYRRNILDLQREKLKQPTPEERKIREENRKTLKDLDKEEANLIAQLKNIRKASDTFENYSKNSILGTGKIANLVPIGEGREAVEQAFSKLNLDTLSKSAQNMAQLFNTEPERAIFEKGQPSFDKADKVNRDTLSDQYDATNSLLQKVREKKRSITREGNWIEPKVDNSPKKVEPEIKTPPYDLKTEAKIRNYMGVNGTSREEAIKDLKDKELL